MEQQTDLFGDVVVDERERVTLTQVEAWLREEASPRWLDGYLWLRGRGVRYRDAMLATWLSLAKDDRGSIATRDDFARVMGVARATTYDWEGRRPEIRQWAELLQVMRMRGMRLAEVDERTYEAAAGKEGRSTTAADRKLYYQRAGVWEEELGVLLREGDEESLRDLVGRGFEQALARAYGEGNADSRTGADRDTDSRTGADQDGGA